MSKMNKKEPRQVPVYQVLASYVINGEPGCSSRDGLDFLFHLGGGSGLVVEAAVEIVIGQVVGRDVGLCRGRQCCSAEQEHDVSFHEG